MFKKLTLTVDPNRTDPTKLSAILRTNPAPRTNCKRHSSLLRLVGVCLHEVRTFGIPLNPDAEISRVTYRNYID